MTSLHERLLAATAATAAPALPPLPPFPRRTADDVVAWHRAAGEPDVAAALAAFLAGSVVRQVVFHGTKADVVAFDRRFAGQTDPGLVGKAFYFSPTAEQAASFAESPHYGTRHGPGAPGVLPCFVAIRRPYWIRDAQVPEPGLTLQHLLVGGGGGAFQRTLRRRGHDGVLFTTGGALTQVVAFEPTQIKSALGNAGTYDPRVPWLTDRAPLALATPAPARGRRR